VVRIRASTPSSPSRAGGALIRALVLAYIALTAACAPRLQQEGVEMRMPAIEQVEQNDGALQERYVTRDGVPLGLMRWDSAMPKAVIVALHGMNDYSNAFSIPAPWWAKQGITTYAYDQRGFGRSPQRGIWPGSKLMRRDLSDFVDVVRRRHPGVPVFVLGESMGGAVAITAFTSDMPPKADGLILIAPAVWGRGTMPLLYRIVLWAGAHTFRGSSFSGSRLNILPSDNIEMLRANARDPLFIKGTRTDTIYGLVQLMGDAYEAAPRLNGTPILYLYGGKDEIIPKRPTETAMKALGPKGKAMIYPTGYHMLLRDLNAEPRWADVVRWIEEQTRGGEMLMAAE
jgi:alpha-beta hydrolase superfamily lysophospholipase